jgi:hypothetical protein
MSYPILRKGSPAWRKKLIMKYDKRLNRLDDYYCRKIISCYLGTFQSTTYNPDKTINPEDRIMEEIERERRGVFPEALNLLTPEERKKYKVREAYMEEAYDIFRKVTKVFTKHYKPRVSRRTI